MDAGHPRDVVCETAGRELWTWLADWRARHVLTHAETAFLLCTIQGRLSQAAAVAERTREEVLRVPGTAG